VTIDGKLYHVSKNGYAIDRYAKGLHEIDGGMYYVKENGSVLTNSAVDTLLLMRMAAIPLAMQRWTAMWIRHWLRAQTLA